MSIYSAHVLSQDISSKNSVKSRIYIIIIKVVTDRAWYVVMMLCNIYSAKVYTIQVLTLRKLYQCTKTSDLVEI